MQGFAPQTSDAQGQVNVNNAPQGGEYQGAPQSQPQGSQQPQGQQQPAGNAGATSDVVDQSFASYYSNMQPNMGGGYPGYMPNYYQPQQQVQEQPANQQAPQVQTQPVEIPDFNLSFDEDSLEEMAGLIDSDGKKFLKKFGSAFGSSVNNYVKEAIEKGVQSRLDQFKNQFDTDFEKKVSTKLEQQQQQQEVQQLVHKTYEGLQKANIYPNPYLTQTIGVHLDQNGEAIYNQYKQNYNALKMSGQLNPQSFPVNSNGTPLSRVDFLANYAVKMAQDIVSSQTGMNNQTRTPGMNRTTTMNPVFPTGSGFNGQPASGANRIDAMDEASFAKYREDRRNGYTS